MNVTLMENATVIRFHHIMRRIPALAFLKIANLVGDDNMKKNANRYAKVIYFFPIYINQYFKHSIYFF